MTTTVPQIFQTFSNHAIKTLSIEGGFDGLMQQYFKKEDDLKKFKTNLNIAIANAYNTQADKVKEAMEDNLLKAKVCNSILKIIQLGAVVDYHYIYFTKFGGKNPSAEFNLQYQAEIKILEQNGFSIIEKDYVLQAEFAKFQAMSEEQLKNGKIKYWDMQERKKDIKAIVSNLACGWILYRDNNDKSVKLHVIEGDRFKISYEASTKKSENAGKTNLKYQTNDALYITLIHRLFDTLILKDWSEDDFKTLQEPQINNNLHSSGTVRTVNDLLDDDNETQEPNIDTNTSDITAGVFENTITQEENTVKDVSEPMPAKSQQEKEIEITAEADEILQEILKGQFETVTTKNGKNVIKMNNIQDGQYNKSLWINELTNKDYINAGYKFYATLEKEPQHISIKFKELTKESVKKYIINLPENE